MIATFDRETMLEIKGFGETICWQCIVRRSSIRRYHRLGHNFGQVFTGPAIRWCREAAAGLLDLSFTCHICFDHPLLCPSVGKAAGRDDWTYICCASCTSFVSELGDTGLSMPRDGSPSQTDLDRQYQANPAVLQHWHECRRDARKQTIP